MPYIEWTEAPECPLCGAEYDDPDSLKMEDDDELVIDCQACDGRYHITARVTSEYSTRPWTDLDQARKVLRIDRNWERFMRGLCGKFLVWTNDIIHANDCTLAAERRVAELEAEPKFHR